MQSKDIFRKRVTQRAILAFAIAGLVLLPVLFAGCKEAEDPTGLTEGLTQSEAAASAMGPPTMSELQSALRLDSEQVEAIQAALDRWQQAARTNKARRFREGDSGMRGRGGHFRGTGHRRLAIDFLADVIPVLRDDQIQPLVQCLSDHREKNIRKGRFQGRGQERAMRMLARRLGLSNEQRSELHEALADARDAGLDLREKYRDETLNREQLRENVRKIRERLSEDMEQILTEEQMQKWHEMKEARKNRIIERRLEHLGQGMDRHIEILARLLELSDSQKAAITEILKGTLPEREATLKGLRDGDISMEDAMDKLHQTKDDTIDAIRATLTDKQIDRFEILRPLIGGRLHP